MRTRHRILLGAIVATMSLGGASGASAATEAGNNNCTTLAPGPPFTFLGLSNPPGFLPAAAPVAGVVTKWKVNFTPEAIVPQKLKVARPTGGPNTFQIVGESPTVNIVQGLNVFDTRTPVQPGDRFGLQGTPITILCAPAPGSVAASFPGDVPVGSTQVFSPEENLSVPVTVLIEPDADNDGFGDETQDRCPQSAAIQTECPVVVVDTFAIPRKNKVLVLVATTSSATVTVSGSARFPNLKRKARSSAQAKLAKVTKPVPAGTLTRFTLNFPAKLKSALTGLPRGKSATLRIQASTTDVAGRAVVDRANLKLRGAKKRRAGAKG
jgi:hypothetical protein